MSRSRCRSWGRLGGVVFAQLLSACGHRPTASREPQMLYIHFHGATNMNPDERGVPFPVVVRVVQLVEATDFSKISDQRLLQDGKRILRAAWLTEHETTVYPGSHIELSIAKQPRARQLGVIALFRMRGPPDMRSKVVAQIGSTHFHVPIEGASIRAGSAVNPKKREEARP